MGNSTSSAPTCGCPKSSYAVGVAREREGLGGFIHEHRARAQISLRKLGELAGVSNVYLSQIEANLRKPSAEILQKIAKALEISAESLYVQAGILDEDRTGTTELAIQSDPRLSDAQRQALLTILRSFLTDNDAEGKK
ncbi:MAG: helix-turn-helix domain-containing protein [Acidobacteria bacterium]|nr:helix-turn-helix domain-containing protein [Acidobacteriota bacterium]